MLKQDIPAAVDRLEGIAAEVLEDLIADVEQQNDITVKDVSVEVVPSGGGDSASVNVTVSISQPG